jgi:DNA-binding MarR family transcriptional regulator
MAHRSPDEHLGFLLWRSGRSFVDMLQQELSQRGFNDLTNAHMNLMPFLDSDGTRTTQLAQRMGTSKQAVTKLVDDLEAKGYMSRASDPSDGRAKIVVFTGKGLRLLEAGERAKIAIEQRCLSGHSQRERRLLVDALKKIVLELETGR